MKKIGTEELQQKLESDNIRLVEVLDREEYEKVHIKGAVHIPMNKIVTEARNRFGKEDEIVVYCSDENCSASPTAAKKLIHSGFENVYHYKGGKKAWQKASLPME